MGSTVSKTVNLWYIKECEYNGNQLITKEYSMEGTLLGEHIKEVDISSSESFIIGIWLGYFGTYDNRGYENKFRNVKLINL